MRLSCLQANLNFQSALHQAKSWRNVANEHKRELDLSRLQLTAAQESLETQARELKDTQAQLVEARAGKEKIIDDYMDSEEYQNLITQHDQMIYPAHYTLGWNGAKEVVLADHPGLFDPSSAYPCPENATVLRTLFGQDGDA